MAKIPACVLSDVVKTATGAFAPEKQFVKDLDKTIEFSQAESMRMPSKTFKPSSLGGCERNLYFQLTGVLPDNDTRSSMLIGICESGTDRHIRIQQHIIDMKNYGIDCEYVDVEEFVKSRNLTDIEIVSKDGIETKCYNKKYNISFLTDGLVRYKGQYYILEIKTETSNKFWQHTDVRPEHIAQGVTYYLSFGIDQVLYLYENRDTTGHKAYVYHVSEEDAAKIVQKMESINKFVADSIVPDKTTDESKCKYCGYVSECGKYANQLEN
jgi:CRISPR/Cas system-associated exonuclease Cas4 (RecB family)